MATQPNKRIRLPDNSIVEFPSAMSDADIEHIIQQQFPPPENLVNTAAAGVTRGASNFLNMLGAPIRWGESALGIPHSDNPITSLLNQVGLAQPARTPEGRLAQDIAEPVGASIPSTAIGLGLANQAGPMAAPVLQAIKNSPMGYAASELISGLGAGVGGVTADQIFPGNKWARAAGNLIGGMTPSMALASARAMLRGGSAGRQATQQAIDTFQAAGTTPTAGQAAPHGTASGFFTRAVEKASSSTPGGANVMARKLARQADEIGSHLNRMADDLYASSDKAYSGRVIEKAITGPGGFIKRSGATSARVWQKVDDLIPEQTPVDISNLRGVVDKLSARVRNAPGLSEIFAHPAISKLARGIEADQAVSGSNASLTYASLKDLRRIIGEKLGSPDLISDLPRSELKQVYGALSRDMEAAAQKVGPDAVSAFSRANRFTRALHDRVDDFLTPLLRKRTPEQVYAAATAGRQGGTTIRAIKHSLTPKEWKVIVSTTIKELAKPNPSDPVVFNPETFARNYRRLDPVARRALFSGPGLEGLDRNLGKVVDAIDRISESNRTIFNPSGTAAATANLAGYSALGYSVISGNFGLTAQILALMAGNYAMSRALLTNPAFVRWMARGTAIGGRALPGHIARLSAVLNNESDDVKEAGRQLLGSLSMGNQNE